MQRIRLTRLNNSTAISALVCDALRCRIDPSSFYKISLEQAFWVAVVHASPRLYSLRFTDDFSLAVNSMPLKEKETCRIAQEIYMGFIVAAQRKSLERLVIS
jgi:hypothetical protein